MLVRDCAQKSVIDSQKLSIEHPGDMFKHVCKGPLVDHVDFSFSDGKSLLADIHLSDRLVGDVVIVCYSRDTKSYCRSCFEPDLARFELEKFNEVCLEDLDHIAREVCAKKYFLIPMHVYRTCVHNLKTNRIDIFYTVSGTNPDVYNAGVKINSLAEIINWHAKIVAPFSNVKHVNFFVNKELKTIEYEIKRYLISTNGSVSWDVVDSKPRLKINALVLNKIELCGMYSGSDAATHRFFGRSMLTIFSNERFLLKVGASIRRMCVGDLSTYALSSLCVSVPEICLRFTSFFGAGYNIAVRAFTLGFGARARFKKDLENSVLRVSGAFGVNEQDRKTYILFPDIKLILKRFGAKLFSNFGIHSLEEGFEFQAGCRIAFRQFIMEPVIQVLNINSGKPTMFVKGFRFGMGARAVKSIMFGFVICKGSLIPTFDFDLKF